MLTWDLEIGGLVVLFGLVHPTRNLVDAHCQVLPPASQAQQTGHVFELGGLQIKPLHGGHLWLWGSFAGCMGRLVEVCRGCMRAILRMDIPLHAGQLRQAYTVPIEDDRRLRGPGYLQQDAKGQIVSLGSAKANSIF